MWSLKLTVRQVVKAFVIVCSLLSTQKTLFTSSLDLGLVVPIPTLPSWSILIASSNVSSFCVTKNPKPVLESVSEAVSLIAAILAPTKLLPGVVPSLPAILNLIPTPSPPA